MLSLCCLSSSFSIQSGPKYKKCKNRKRKIFFISHSNANKEYADWIAWALEEAGYSMMFDSWDFSKGKGFIDCMNEGMVGCERVIAVASPKYWEANYMHPEWKYFNVL